MEWVTMRAWQLAIGGGMLFLSGVMATGAILMRWFRDDHPALQFLALVVGLLLIVGAMLLLTAEVPSGGC